MRSPLPPLLCASLFSLLIVSCGSEDDDPYPYGTAGTSGTGGVSGGGGTGGSGGAGGSTGGSGGSGAQAGSGGATGGAGGATGGSGGATGGAGGSSLSCDMTEHTGEATYYDADGSGNCSFDPSPNDLMVAAMNHTDYADSAACGACVHLTGPNGSVTVRIVDRCPECPQGDIDLSPQAFSQIADLVQGRVPITWTYVPCNVQGPIVYHFKDGSNEWWTAVQIRNHTNAIAAFEYMTSGGTYQSVGRLDYNFFVESSGMGPGPYTFRVTDVYGQVVEDSGIPHVENGDVPGTGQFPPCL